MKVFPELFKHVTVLTAEEQEEAASMWERATCNCAEMAEPHFHIKDWRPQDYIKMPIDNWKDAAAEHHRSCDMRKGIPRCTCGE